MRWLRFSRTKGAGAELGHAARLLAEQHYGWERIGGRLVEIYEELVGVARREAVAA